MSAESHTKHAKNIPSVELLRQTHVFPGNYTIKAIGPREGAFVARIVAAAREELASSQDPPYTCRESEKKAHIAVTLELSVSSPEQVQSVYERLLEIPDLILLL